MTKKNVKEKAFELDKELVMALSLRSKNRDLIKKLREEITELNGVLADIAKKSLDLCTSYDENFFDSIEHDFNLEDPLNDSDVRVLRAYLSFVVTREMQNEQTKTNA